MGKQVLGIDVGGSGIKGAPVDVEEGKMLTERFRIPTPEGGKPEDIAEVINQVAKNFEWKGPIGMGFPSAIRDGVALTAANIHKSWVGTHIPTIVNNATNCPAIAINDADAAGIAEMQFGGGANRTGTVIFITVGTGLGTALFHDGKLFPNCELGHLELNGRIAEKYASDAVRKAKDLDWKQWAKRFNEYLTMMEGLFWPRLIILGGGVSRKKEKYIQYLDIKAEITAATLRNEAGIIGAAFAASNL